MKQLIIIILALASNCAYSQFYYSSQTGEASNAITEQHTETLAEGQKAAFTISIDAKGLVFSPDLSGSYTMGEKQSLTLSTTISVDTENPPADGETETSLISVQGSAKWVTGEDGNGNRIWDGGGSKFGTRKYTVTALNIVISAAPCNCGSWSLSANATPTSKITWYVGDEIVGGGLTFDLPYDKKYEGSFVYAKLEAGGVSYTSNSVQLTINTVEQVKFSQSGGSNIVNLGLKVIGLGDITCDLEWSGPGTENCDGLNCPITKDDDVSMLDDKISVTYNDKCGSSGSFSATGVHAAEVIDVSGPSAISVANHEYIDWSRYFGIVWSRGYKPDPIPQPRFSDNLLYNPLGAGYDGWVCRVEATVIISINGVTFVRKVLITNTDPHCQ